MKCLLKNHFFRTDQDSRALPLHQGSAIFSDLAAYCFFSDKNTPAHPEFIDDMGVQRAVIACFKRG